MISYFTIPYNIPTYIILDRLKSAYIIKLKLLVCVAALLNSFLYVINTLATQFD